LSCFEGFQKAQFFEYLIFSSYGDIEMITIIFKTGPKGDKGERGQMGLYGVPGTKGDRGVMGPQGMLTCIPS
jgi:hypothetical protein